MEIQEEPLVDLKAVNDAYCLVHVHHRGVGYGESSWNEHTIGYIRDTLNKPSDSTIKMSYLSFSSGHMESSELTEVAMSKDGTPLKSSNACIQVTKIITKDEAQEWVRNKWHTIPENKKQAVAGQVGLKVYVATTEIIVGIYLAPATV